MAPPDPDSDPFDTPAIYCRHLLICRTIWYDPAKADEGYSLGRLVVDLRPPPGVTGRFVVSRLFAFFQLFGDIADYDLRIRLVEVVMEEDGDETERTVKEWGPVLLPVSGLELVEPHCFILTGVPFDRPGLYEFQLWCDEHDEPLAAERVRVEELIQELP